MIKDFEHERFFGPNWWRYVLPTMTVEGLESVLVVYNRKTPDCIRITFRGIKLTNVTGQTLWNTLNPVTDQEEYDPMFDSILQDIISEIPK